MIVILTLFLSIECICAENQEPEQKWVWVQQKNYKSIEKHGFHIERIGSIFAYISQEKLRENLSVLSFYGSNCREFVFAVAHSEELSCIEHIIFDTIQEISNAYSQLTSPPPLEESWFSCFKKGVAFGIGPSTKEAYLNFRLSAFTKITSYDDWLKHTQELHQKFSSLILQNQIPKQEFLYILRKSFVNPCILRPWLNTNNLSSYENEIVEYRNLVSLGDYFDPSHFIQIEPQIRALENDTNWTHLLILDIRDFGVKKFQILYEWVSRGANLQELELNATSGDKIIANLFLRVFGHLEKLDLDLNHCCVQIADSLTVALCITSEDTCQLLSDIFADKDFHVALVERNKRSITQILNESAILLKKNKG
jgi:hypothetical protein